MFYRAPVSQQRQSLPRLLSRRNCCFMGEETVCAEALSETVRGNDDTSRSELKRDHQCLGDADNRPDSLPTKKQAKEISNDDIRSEVTNPNVSPKENTSAFQDITSHLSESENVNHVECGELTSTCLENSSYEETSSDGEGIQNSTTTQNDNKVSSDDVTTSRVVLEIPKHASSTGIRKITFKFSKKREDNESHIPASVNQTLHSGFTYDAVCDFHQEEEEEEEEDGDSDKDEEDDESSAIGYGGMLMENSYEMDYAGGNDSCNAYARNMELKMSKKVVANCYPTNVKKLLSTGILDGARVKYASTAGDVELCGIIEGGGYLCGCFICNYSRVLSAYEFERHAGVKTRHPNNHIYLDNGRPIYNIIQELKTAPVGILDEVLKDVAGSALNDHSFQVWKASLWNNNQNLTEDRYYSCKLSDGPYSLVSQATKSVYSLPHSYASYDLEQPIFLKRKTEKQKRTLKRLRPSPYISSSIAKQKKTVEGYTKRRDNDLHRLLFMPNGLPDGAELAYYVKGQRLLGGYKQGNGIVCSCCDREVSPSQFEAHAGMAARRQPYRHIYTSNGLTLHDIALSLANGQNIATGDSDDMCAVCGDGGDLVVCNGCPRAFHPDCLDLQYVPDGTWHCVNCRDNAANCRETTREFSGAARPIMIRLSRVVRAPDFEIGGCVVCREHDFSVTTFDERTVIICDQCEKEYHVGCLRVSGLCELTELPKDKWFCSDDCNKIFDALQNSVSNGAEIVPASLSSIISKKHVQRGLQIDGSVDGIQWRILSGKSRYPEHLPILSRAAAIFRECFDPIVARSGRDLIPVMVYGRNISGQEFGGMYCVVLIVKSVVVSAGLLRIFGRGVAELPLVATSREYQGKGYFQVLFSRVERLLFSLNVENLVLPAAEDAESIWTKKLGFRKMSEEQLSRYLREVQLTIFKGTSMLEKAVQRIAE